MVNSEVKAGWFWPSWWQEDLADPSTIEIARELAELDAESPEDCEALFYGLLDFDDESLVEAYLNRL
jgi:hypothetical protein